MSRDLVKSKNLPKFRFALLFEKNLLLQSKICLLKQFLKNNIPKIIA
jgi:hypothetical protein